MSIEINPTTVDQIERGEVEAPAANANINTDPHPKEIKADMRMNPATGEWEDVHDKPARGARPRPRIAMVFNKEKDVWEEREIDEDGKELAPEPEKPRRSMVKGGQAGTFDFKFVDSDNVTVLCRYIKNPEEIEQRQNSFLEATAENQKKARAFQDFLATAGANITPEQVREQGIEIRNANTRAEAEQNKLAQGVVRSCVVGWENGTVPFSASARDNLPDEVAVEWMQVITNRSQLTKKDADFLASSSTPLSEGAP